MFYRNRNLHRQRYCVLVCRLMSVIACVFYAFFFFFQAEDGIRDLIVTGVQTCALPICDSQPLRGLAARARRGPVDGANDGYIGCSWSWSMSRRQLLAGILAPSGLC